MRVVGAVVQIELHLQLRKDDPTCRLVAWQANVADDVASAAGNALILLRLESVGRSQALIDDQVVWIGCAALHMNRRGTGGELGSLHNEPIHWQSRGTGRDYRHYRQTPPLSASRKNLLVGW
jgi:hypothetical protein